MSLLELKSVYSGSRWLLYYK